MEYALAFHAYGSGVGHVVDADPPPLDRAAWPPWCRPELSDTVSGRREDKELPA
ncbi:hypothetical protein [Streptomyces murinus]|uniref:hypothetical protein n=1 Tax=Streptomyces murinus TaxID=33900 RepID=UPI000DC3768D|nr:hypothetical protein K376_06739 [Streptomyces sp. PsTaAH-130]